MIDFRETESFETLLDTSGEKVSKFANAGYDSANYWQLLGAIFFVILAFAAWTGFKALFKRAVRPCGDNCLTRRLRRKNKYGVIIMRFLLEGCLEMGLSAAISVMMMEKETFEDFWEAICVVSAFITLIVLVLAPLYIKYLAQQYMQTIKKGKDEKESEHYELFESYRANEVSLLYPVIFFIRRFSMILVLTTMPGFKYAQILMQLGATMSVIAHLWSRPN